MLPATKKLLNHMSPLPRALNNLVGLFAKAILPLETEYNVLWGLLDLNIAVGLQIQVSLGGWRD